MAPKAIPAPDFCQYADGQCDQELFATDNKGPFFIYPSAPPQIAAAIDHAAKFLRNSAGPDAARTWKQLPIAGQVIFCEICKAMREASVVFADVTTLNFNVLFEIGFAIGLNVPVVPIRDTTYIRDKREFDELGVLDTIGYVEFANSADLIKAIPDKLSVPPLPQLASKVFRESPLYFLKGRIETEGAMTLQSILKKSPLKFRAYDQIETPRLSLTEARRQVSGSYGLIAHLLSPNRQGARSHNGLCAMLSGMAMAQQKPIAMLQEEHVTQPIDYRDVVKYYTHPDQLPALVQSTIHAVADALQTARHAGRRSPTFLEQIDLGDTAAENEIAGLNSYFVPTGQFTQAKQGHARLVVGRKGTGKTAIFYGLRAAVPKGHSTLVLDLKPEGHQFTRLREHVLSAMSLGLQEHTMTAFWHYILLTELARRVLFHEETFAKRDHDRYAHFVHLQQVYERHDPCREEDFSQRLLAQVERLSTALHGVSTQEVPGQITQKLYLNDLRELSVAIIDYVKEKQRVWILVDNIDKGWPTRGTTDSDIVIVRSLLEAARKLQRDFESNEINVSSLVFIRTDIHEHLLKNTPDKGKDTAISLDWDDREVFKEIVRKRLEDSTGLAGTFDELWSQVFETHVGIEDSFWYCLNRTLMRPRDLLTLLHRALETAVNRGRQKVMADDVEQAEKGYSEDLLLITAYEIADVYPDLHELLYLFEGCKPEMRQHEVYNILEANKLSEKSIVRALDLLLWFGFLGVRSPKGEPKYSYEVRHNVSRLKSLVDRDVATYVVHPGFRRALSID